MTAEALNLGVPLSSISEAVFARAISSSGDLRVASQAALSGPCGVITVKDVDSFIDQIRQALWASTVIAYGQGLHEIAVAAQTYAWTIDMGVVAKIWRNGCIIRARLLDRIYGEYAQRSLTTLLEAPSFRAQLADSQEAWRLVISTAVLSGVPVPGMASALSYYDQLRAPRLNAALTQGLRDFFGAHTYRRIDQSGSFHTLWSADRSEIKVSD